MKVHKKPDAGSLESIHKQYFEHELIVNQKLQVFHGKKIV